MHAALWRLYFSVGSNMPRPSDSALSVHGLTKKFGDFLANNSIDFDLKSGEVHALLGENGAGKSTLVRMLYGSLQPISGEIRREGSRAEIHSPLEARSLGIGMVFCHFSLFEALNVAENLFDTFETLKDEGRSIIFTTSFGYTNMPDDVVAMAKQTQANLTANEFEPFTGPITRQDGSEWLKDSEAADIGTLLGMNFYVKSVDDQLPQ